MNLIAEKMRTGRIKINLTKRVLKTLYAHIHQNKQQTNTTTTKARQLDLEKFENPHFSVSKLVKT